MRDKVRKGRHFYTYGHLGYSKLTTSEVVEIRAAKVDGVTYQEIADKYKISLTQAWRIIKGKRWSAFTPS